MSPRTVQEWLCLHGFPVVIDGDVGPETSGALIAFQARDGLPMTGMPDAATCVALETPLARAQAAQRLAVPDASQALAAVAKQHLREHPREIETVPNSGPWVRAYCDGLEGRPWCAYWLRALARQVGRLGWVLPSVFDPDCDRMADKAKELGRLIGGSRLVAGDLFLVGSSDDFTHTGLVLEVSAGSWRTAEGNTDYAGQRNGTMAIGRERRPTRWGISLTDGSADGRPH